MENKYLSKILNVQKDFEKEFEGKRASFSERLKELKKRFEEEIITNKVYEEEKEKIIEEEKEFIENAVNNVKEIAKEYDAFLDSITINGESLTDDAKILNTEFNLTQDELQKISNKYYYNPTMQRLVDNYLSKNPAFSIERPPTLEERSAAFKSIVDGIIYSFRNYDTYTGRCYSVQYIDEVIERNKKELYGADNLGSNTPLENIPIEN